MSTLTVQPIRNAIKQACIDAWTLGADDVTFGNPRVLEPKLPYAVIRLDQVPMEPNAVNTVEQTYSFEITLVGNWGEGVVIEDVKVEKANAIITQLMTAPLFAGIARLPMVHEVSFMELDDPNQPTYEITVTFSLVTEQLRLV